ncbi:MAG TPA: LptA/OstA family protein [Chthoniobacteraceae bacterium]
MVKFVATLCLGGFVAAASVHAQAPAAPSKPAQPSALSEKELLNTLDTLGAGDPLKKQPLSIGVGDTKLGTPTKRDEKPLKKDKGPTEITALEATFDQKSSQAVFIGNVVVKDPEFNVVCDQLTAVLKSQKSTGKPAAAAAEPAPARTENTKKKDEKGGGLERAVAEASPGKRVIITQEKLEADGSLTRYVGKAEKADYDTRTGDIILTGWPEVNQGINSIVATDRETVITLNRDGRMKTNGAHKTVIKDQGPETSSR